MHTPAITHIIRPLDIGGGARRGSLNYRQRELIHLVVQSFIVGIGHIIIICPSGVLGGGCRCLVV